MRDSNGQAFTVMIDSTTLNNAEAAKGEFAGLASDPLPSASIEEVEYEGWLATEEELTTSINWAKNNAPVDEDAFAVAPLNQSCRTIILLDNHPFFVDTGTSIHISPDCSDFITLHIITP